MTMIVTNPSLSEESIGRTDFLTQLYADETLQATSIERELQAEVAALPQIPPFRYLDKIFAARADVDGILGWVELKAQEDRLYDGALSGSFLIEALAQLSSVLIRRHTGSTNGGMLTAIEWAKFGSGQPDDRGILLHARLKTGEFPYFTMECVARQGSRVLCACSLTSRVNTGDQE